MYPDLWTASKITTKTTLNELQFALVKSEASFWRLSKDKSKICWNALLVHYFWNTVIVLTLYSCMQHWIHQSAARFSFHIVYYWSVKLLNMFQCDFNHIIENVPSWCNQMLLIMAIKCIISLVLLPDSRYTNPAWITAWNSRVCYLYTT